MYIISIQIRGEQFYLTSKKRSTLMVTRDYQKAKVWVKKPTNTLLELQPSFIYDKTSQGYVFNTHESSQYSDLRIESKKVIIILN